MFRQELDLLAKTCTRFQVYYINEQHSNLSPLHQADKIGGVDADIIRKHLPTNSIFFFTYLAVDDVIIICNALHQPDIRQKKLRKLGFAK